MPRRLKSAMKKRHDHAAGSGSHVRSTRLQSIPSSNIESWARVSDNAPLSALVQMNLPRSRRLAKRQIPSPSAHKSFTMSPRLPRKTKTWPDRGSFCSTCCTWALSPSNPRRISVGPAASQIRVPVGSSITESVSQVLRWPMQDPPRSRYSPELCLETQYGSRHRSARQALR